MVVEMVPLKGGIGSIQSPNWQYIHTTYIPLIVLAEPGGLYNPYHPLQEPEKSTDHRYKSNWKRKIFDSKASWEGLLTKVSREPFQQTLNIPGSSGIGCSSQHFW